jgi:hypothetical protein
MSAEQVSTRLPLNVRDPADRRPVGSCSLYHLDDLVDHKFVIVLVHSLAGCTTDIRQQGKSRVARHHHSGRGPLQGSRSAGDVRRGSKATPFLPVKREAPSHAANRGEAGGRHGTESLPDAWARTLGSPYPPGRVPWHRKPGFKLVAVKEVRRLTGLEVSELLHRPNVQRLTRIDESGAREELLRVPVELLIEEPTD